MIGKTKNDWRRALFAGTILGGVFGGITAAGGLALVADFSYWGRVKQGISATLDQEGGPTWGPANFIAEIAAALRINRNLQVTADLWMRADWYPYLKGNLVDRGIQNYDSPNFRDQFGYRLNQGGNTYSGDIPFGSDAKDIRWYTDLDDIIRELSVTYRSDDRSVALKAGSFVRGWGQSDGLRLLDILNPQDFRSRFALSNSDELRIPQTGVALDVDLARLGIGGPFEAIGISKPSFEILYFPQVRTSEFIVNNPTPSDQTDGGVFGFPYPYLDDPVSGRGLPYIGANLHDLKPDEWSWEEGEIAGRFKFNALGAEIAFSGFYGWQDLPVVTLQGGTLLVGTNYNDPDQALLQVPLDVPTSTFITHGPGMYIDQLRLTNALNGLLGPIGDLDLPLIGPINQITPFACTNLAVVEGCSVNFDFNLDYRYRQKLVGFSLTRDLKELRFGGKQVNPVLRLEASYEFDKPFNRSAVPTQWGVAEGSAALVVPPEDAITYRDQLAVMVGFDFPLWVPFWDSQRKSIFTSFQFFNFHTFDSANLMYQAPYAQTPVHANHMFVTGFWNMQVDNEQLVFEGLAAYDINNSGFAYRQRIDFNYFGDSIRPRLEYIHVNARNGVGPFGFIDDADIVEFSLTYQF
ncbi:hypothetical protein L2U69_15225 [Zavarzinia compransoris]|uniref:hypothetical protein n=1 Tax=Zavarzinia marina TaxID=2911065 RepID=UPI001F1B9DC7|nr:hypothetical protein [Zavarzinia marina]MCF4167003.1 hypothetical protein [Zavarzinia marina]